MHRFRFESIAPAPEDAYVLARVTLLRGDTIQLHTHDFAEIHWVEQGEGEHRVNGMSVPVRASHLLLIRPTDVHGFECGGDQDLVFVVLAFRRKTLTHLRTRYFSDMPSFYGGTARLPKAVELDGEQLRLAGAQADILANAPRTLFHLERFLLNLFFIIHSHPSRQVPAACPNWLRRAYTTIQCPEVLTGGVKAFKQVCGRSAAHVSRACRQWLGATPSQIVTRFRMDHAAKQLAMTDRSILDISMECGFDSLSHFYRLFKQRHGISPNQYRVRNKFTAGS
jgi:AraC family cel operon transcriptional repressor